MQEVNSKYQEDIYIISDDEWNDILMPRHLKALEANGHAGPDTVRVEHFLLAIVGEYVARKVLERDYGISTKESGHLKNHTYDLVLPDGGGFQVRSSMKTDGPLFVKPAALASQHNKRKSDSSKDALEDIYLHSVPLDPPANRTWKVTGWMIGSEVLEIGYTDRYSRVCVGQQHLHPVLELIFPLVKSYSTE